MRIIINVKTDKLDQRNALSRVQNTPIFNGKICECTTFYDCVVIHKELKTGSHVFDIIERNECR